MNDKRLNDEIKEYIQTLFDEFKVERGNQATQLIEELKKDIETLIKWKVENEVSRIDGNFNECYKRFLTLEEILERIKASLDKINRFNHLLKQAVEEIDG